LIKRETKKNVFDHLDMENINFSGRMKDIEFLDRLYPLKKMKSEDSRYENAYGDIWQHTENNLDYERNWVFRDYRFELLEGSDDIFLKFLCEMIHPLVRQDQSEVQKILAIANDWIRVDGWEIYPTRSIAGGSLYSFKTTSGNTEAMPNEKELANIWSHNKIRLFISHRDQYKVDVKNLSNELAIHGISGFVAHESIPEQSFWRTEILKALRSMDACLCYITDDFFDSIWTNQEIGYALAKGVPIYLYRVNKTDPKGFLSDIQAIKTGQVGLLACIKKDFSNNSNFKNSFVQNFIAARDGSFDRAKERFFDLVGLIFDDTEIETIAKAFTSKAKYTNQLTAILYDTIKEEHKEHPVLRKYSHYRDYLNNDIFKHHSSKTYVVREDEKNRYSIFEELKRGK